MNGLCYLLRVFSLGTNHVQKNQLCSHKLLTFLWKLFFFSYTISNYIDGISLSLIFLMYIHAKILIKYRQATFMLYILTLMGLESWQSCILMMRKSWTNRKLTTLLRSIRKLKSVENCGPENWTGRQKQSHSLARAKATETVSE